MSKEDDFFDKYVESSSSKKSTNKGNVKKDLFSAKNSSTKTKKDITKDFVKESNENINPIVETKETIPAKKKKTTNIIDTEKVETKKATSIKDKNIIPNKDTESVIENSLNKEKTDVETVEEKPTRKRKTKIVENDVNNDINTLISNKDTANNSENEEEVFSKDTIMQNEEVFVDKPKTRTRKKSAGDKAIEDYNTNYITKSLSQTIHESMIPYSEFVILDRAIPRVEDGLKPVQRRVLYSMLEVGVLPDRPHKKCASIVGECMGKYHPHGDTSIYDTLVRLAQPFNMNEPLVDGHGNFGSVDGDGAAAMRYTEARLSPVALEMLRDLEKETVPWGLNFDDRLKEPIVLPGRFPNLLVNGSQGIAVGLATNIPTHNLVEAINATIAYIDDRNISVKELMKIMPGPDFPSGAYILNSSELKEIYTTGKGKIYIRSKISIENADNGRKNIVISEIPFQVNKAQMLQKIAKYRDANPNGPLGAIYEIVDESDRFGTRAVIKLKKEAKINSILNTLYKYCDVQTTFGANIVAIADGKPRQMGLREILEYYVNFQQQVIYNRTKYDLDEALKKEHILEGLLIAIRNIDEVVRIIKNSKNVTDAKITLMKTFDLDDIQAQAILDMRLARLTSLEVNKLITDLNRLRDLIKRYSAILKSPTLQMKVVKSELTEIAKTYGRPRRTKFLSAEEHFEDSSSVLESIENEADDIETFHLISTPINTLKTVNLKSYNLVNKELSNNPNLFEIPSISFKIDNNKNVYVFTDKGNCIKLAINQIPETKFRDKGTALFSLAKNVVSDENIVGMFELDENMKDTNLIFVTKLGMVKVTKATDFISSKQVIASIKLAKGDSIVYVDFQNKDKNLCIFTGNGNSVKVTTSDVSVTGRVGLGVKGIALDKLDYVVGASQITISDAFALFMSDGSAKIVKQSEIGDSEKNRKGLSCISPKVKNNKIIFVGRLSTRVNYVVSTAKDKLEYIKVNTLPLDTRVGAGKIVCKDKIVKVYQFVESK